MKTVRVRIDPADPETLKIAKVDLARVDATTEEEIQAQIEEDRKRSHDGCCPLRASCTQEAGSKSI